MDLSKFEFLAVTEVDLAFPTFGTDERLLEEAKKRGFYGGKTPYNKLFDEMFFRGLKSPLKYKDGLDPEWVTRVARYTRALMRSYAPKHENKEAVCAMLLSEIAIWPPQAAETQNEDPS